MVSEDASARLLWDVLEANASMHAVAQCVQLIEEQVDYPVESPEHLLPVIKAHASEDLHLHIDNCRISETRVRRDLPRHYFPIEGRQALISILLAAFEGDRMRQMGLIQEY